MSGSYNCPPKKINKLVSSGCKMSCGAASQKHIIDLFLLNN